MELIHYKNDVYPAFQAKGFAAQFAIPYALHVCKGVGYDVGCMKKEWAFPGAMPIDESFDDGYHALNLPVDNVDYIFSSHMLEHADDWVAVMDYWTSKLRSGGILFLYLPHYDQKYWHPWNDRRHKHAFTVDIIKGYMVDSGYENIFHSERDLNCSFMIFGEKHGRT